MDWGGGRAASLSFRVFGARMFLPAFDAWSIILWVAGISLWLGGRRFLVWCLPAILFLFFMVPLPYRAEHFLNAPLRSVPHLRAAFCCRVLASRRCRKARSSCWTTRSSKLPRSAAGCGC